MFFRHVSVATVIFAVFSIWHVNYFNIFEI